MIDHSFATSKIINRPVSALKLNYFFNVLKDDQQIRPLPFSTNIVYSYFIITLLGKKYIIDTVLKHIFKTLALLLSTIEEFFSDFFYIIFFIGLISR
jgi:hypothetical protein